MKFIPFKKISFDSNTMSGALHLLKTGSIGYGNTVIEFENELAKYTGAKYVVAMDSCTSAIGLALEYYRYKHFGYPSMNCVSNLVGIPSMTFATVASECIYKNINFYFTDNTEWVGSDYKLTGTNIWDSAHDVRKDQLLEKSRFDCICYSFYPTKLIGCPDGGAIATNDTDFANWLKQVVYYGRNISDKPKNSWEYEVEIPGYKKNFNNVNAKLCLEQLKVLDRTRDFIKSKVKYYNQNLDLNNSSLYLYRINVEDRDDFIKHMLKNGVECGVHYKPLHKMKAFENIGVIGDREKIEKDYSTTVSLPLYPSLALEDIDYICELVREWGYIN